MQALTLETGIHVGMREGLWALGGREQGREGLPLLAVATPDCAFSRWTVPGLDTEFASGAATVALRARVRIGPEGIAAQT